MSGRKRHVAEDSSHVKRKKHKKACAVNQDLEADEIPELLLDAEKIQAGMLLLGCVTKVKTHFLEMSLPGLLSGRVPLHKISSPFTKSLKDFESSEGEREEPSLSFVKCGMTFPCRVSEVISGVFKKKIITLSINPADINTDLTPSSLYPKMVLSVAISSKEDHGYVVDVGNKSIKGFIPKQFYQDHRDEFKIGEVIQAVIRQISSDKTSARIQLGPVDSRQLSPIVSVENVNLTSILPGATIIGDVIEITYPFIYIKYLDFIACASVLSYGPAYFSLKIGQEVYGTVLYVHPITHMIFLSLTLKLTLEHSQAPYSRFRNYTLVKDLKHFCSYKRVSYYVIKGGAVGFLHAKDVPKIPPKELLKKACVMRFHYMDNLLQLSAKPSLLETDIILPENANIGDIFEAIVTKHVDGGMFVKISPAASGFVRKIHMSDVYITKPEILYPVGSKVNCRVLSTDGKSKLTLTCKDSWLKMCKAQILSSYEAAWIGHCYPGVIVQKTNDFILVLFFNDVKGIVPSVTVPKGSILFVGQTILCKVVSCNALEKKLKLSFQTERRCSVEENGDLWNELAFFNQDSELLQNHATKYNGINSENLNSRTNTSMFILPSDESSSSFNNEIKPGAEEVKAVIKSIKGNQLNISVNKAKGRVHITEIGYTSDNTYPLKGFSVGDEIQVYVFGEFLKYKKNHLEVSHKNYNIFKECSLKNPPCATLCDIRTGKSLVGFVKEVHDVYVILWLTPYLTGVLEFLHFDDKLMFVKRLHHHLKIGLSIKVSVLEDNGSTVQLTRIEKKPPQPGENIIGLVQVSCPERGLVLKLPFGYHGSVALTDLGDIYIGVQKLLVIYCKSKFLKCHVLEVNHQTKFCQLSLRKSRLYGKSSIPELFFCPEITDNDIKVGKVVKGFVKSVSDSAITVTIGRNIEGKLHIHTCSLANCKLCKISKDVILQYPVGSIAEVIIKEHFKDGRSCIVNLPTYEYLDKYYCEELGVPEDISWKE